MHENTPTFLHNDPAAVTPALPRRTFLARAGLGVLGTVGATRAFAQQPSPALTGAAMQDVWLSKLSGIQGQIFDTPTLKAGSPLSQVRNFLDAYRDAYGLPDTDVDAVVGLHGSAVPLAFNDETWERFSFGETYDVRHAETGLPVSRNVFRAAGIGGPLPAEATIEALQQRGVIFILCNNSLRRVTGTLSAAGFGTTEAVRETLLKGLLPGVEVVPAMVVAMNLAQGKGLSYVYVG